jgi:hypothetical protein
MPSCERRNVPDMGIRGRDQPNFVSRHSCFEEFTVLGRNDRRIWQR